MTIKVRAESYLELHASTQILCHGRRGRHLYLSLSHIRRDRHSYLSLYLYLELHASSQNLVSQIQAQICLCINRVAWMGSNIVSPMQRQTFAVKVAVSRFHVTII